MRITRAQTKALVVKTSGFRDGVDWWLTQYPLTGKLELTVYHVTSVIARDGHVENYSNYHTDDRKFLGRQSASEIQSALYEKAVIE